MDEQTLFRAYRNERPRPDQWDLEDDAEMAARAEDRGNVKCVWVLCGVEMPAFTRDGYCEFHRRTLAMEGRP